ncbi:MAG: hypothetical protein ACR2GX_02765 [Candidatus Dormibacteria bacterium]
MNIENMADRGPHPVPGIVEVVTREPLVLRRRTELGERVDDLRERHPWLLPAVLVVLLLLGATLGRRIR